jgi:hypothetical protein
MNIEAKRKFIVFKDVNNLFLNRWKNIYNKMNKQTKKIIKRCDTHYTI